MSIQSDINKLVEREKVRGSLSTASFVTPIPATDGVAKFKDGKEQDSTAGIASPLTEVSRETETRTLFDDFNVWSTDIVFTTQLNMTDADGRSVIINLNIPDEFL